MRTRAAAALQKALTFQDVRARVRDVGPSAVMSLVELLRQQDHESVVDAEKQLQFRQKIHPRDGKRVQDGTAAGIAKRNTGWQQGRKVARPLISALRSRQAGLCDVNVAC